MAMKTLMSSGEMAGFVPNVAMAYSLDLVAICSRMVVSKNKSKRSTGDMFLNLV